MEKKIFNRYFWIISSVFSFFLFCFTVLLNRIAFILENPNFVFEQDEPIRKWFEINNVLINFVTFAPLGFSIIFLIMFFLKSQKK